MHVKKGLLAGAAALLAGSMSLTIPAEARSSKDKLTGVAVESGLKQTQARGRGWRGDRGYYRGARFTRSSVGIRVGSGSRYYRSAFYGPRARNVYYRTTFGSYPRAFFRPAYDDGYGYGDGYYRGYRRNVVTVGFGVGPRYGYRTRYYDSDYYPRYRSAGFVSAGFAPFGIGWSSPYGYGYGYSPASYDAYGYGPSGYIGSGGWSRASAASWPFGRSYYFAPPYARYSSVGISVRY